MPEIEYGELRVLSRINKYEFGVELKIMHGDLNENHWVFENVEKFYQTFLGQPILCAYVGNVVGDGHNMREVIDPHTGKKYVTYMDGTAERIVGTISDNPEDIKLEESDGHRWIVAKGKLWLIYAPELVDKIVRTGRMSVSAETMRHKSTTNAEGVEIISEWTGIGVTVLGDNVPPAIPGARITVLAALQDEFKKSKLLVAQLLDEKPQKNTKEGVKRAVNTKTLKKLQEKFPEHKVVACSEDGNLVALLSKNGDEAFTYAFRDEDNGEVVASRLCSVNLSTAFDFGEERKLEVSVAEICANACELATAATVGKEKAEKELSAAQELIKTMQTAEHSRRKDAIKAGLIAKMAEIKDANTSADEEALATLSADASLEAYAVMEDKEGKFIGDAKACSDLMARCMEKVIADGKLAACSQKQTFAWDQFNQQRESEGGIAGLLANLHK